MRVSADAEEPVLEKIIVDCQHGQAECSTKAKFMLLRAMMKAVRIHIAKGIESFDALPRYPDGLTEEEKPRLDATIRATFGAMLSLKNKTSGGDAAPAWAKSFWRSNWSLYECRSRGVDDSPAAEDDIAPITAAFRERAIAIQARLEASSLGADPDLYNPDRFEVLTGLASRAIQVVRSAVKNPVQRSLDFGPPFVRIIVESQILTKWLSSRDDAELYRRYKEYGRGNLKLLKLHWDEYVDSLHDPPEDLVQYVDNLETFVGAEIREEFQEIDLSGTFSGKNLRQMASEAGLEREYQFSFSPASSQCHGEWPSLQSSALDVCQNPLHRWHHTLKSDSDIYLSPDLLSAMFELAEQVVDAYESAMSGTSSSADTSEKPTSGESQATSDD